MSTPPASSHGRSSKPTTPSPPTVGGKVAARTAWTLATLVASTTRWVLVDPEHSMDSDHPPRAIFAIWHNRQLLSPEIYQRFLGRRLPGRRLASMASASRDGAIAASVLELFGVRAVRGSSSRRGARALVELIDLARQGFDLAVTPDGPRGPRYEVKPGVVALAQHTGLPLVPISYHLTRKRVLRSWDRFIVPLPFGRCEITVGKVIQVPSDLDEAGREEVARELQSRMLEITRD